MEGCEKLAGDVRRCDSALYLNHQIQEMDSLVGDGYSVNVCLGDGGHL